MAVSAGAKEIQILTPGTDVNYAGLGASYGNMWKRKNGWEVRPGLGVVALLDMSLAVPNLWPHLDFPFSIIRACGSYLLHTDFDHYQTVTVFYGNYVVSDSNVGAQPVPCYVVSIYDITADTHHEEVLFEHSASVTEQGSDLQFIKPFYASDVPLQGLNVLGAVDEEVAFLEYQSLGYGETFHTQLLMCAPVFGVWTYTPCDFSDKNQSAQLSTWQGNQGQAPALGDSSRISPVPATPGPNTDLLGYRTSATFPRPVDMAALGFQVVYAAGKQLYFSDAG